MNAIYKLIEPYSDHPRETPEYVDKMFHRIPDASVVNREEFILERCKGKRVVNFGSSSGPLHGRLKDVVAELTGVDKAGEPDLKIDLDDEHYDLQVLPGAEVYVCGEIIEHLIAPGFFLRRLKWHLKHKGLEGAELVLTVPNAMGLVFSTYAKRAIEVVNKDHVAWYSYTTLKTLLEKCGFELKEWHWYNGRPLFAEGLVVVAV